MRSDGGRQWVVDTSNIILFPVESAPIIMYDGAQAVTSFWYMLGIHTHWRNDSCLFVARALWHRNDNDICVCGSLLVNQ